MAVPAPTTPLTLHVACTSCQGGVELACEGLPAYQGYETFNEYHCPHCRKKNVAKTPGHILAVRASA
jgi:hypothetical protein